MALPAMFLIDIDEKEAAIVHVALDLFPAFAQGCLGTQDQPGLRTVLSAIDEDERGGMKSGRFFDLSMTCFSKGMRPRLDGIRRNSLRAISLLAADMRVDCRKFVDFLLGGLGRPAARRPIAGLRNAKSQSRSLNLTPGRELILQTGPPRDTGRRRCKNACYSHQF